MARRSRSQPAPRRQRPGEITTTPWKEPPSRLLEGMRRDVVLEAGWGRLVFGQTFSDQARLVAVLRDEASGRRDICLYLRDPHVLVAGHPQELFIDPSFTYRLWMHLYRPRRQPLAGVTVRTIVDRSDVEAMNRLYLQRAMVPAAPERIWENHLRTRHVTYLVATEDATGRVIGTVSGVDHGRLFDDPERGSSLWCLAVDPTTTTTGVGEALVRTLAERFATRGAAYLDLSVMHDNAPAIALYRKLGFERVPVLGVKRKNAINEPLYVGSAPDSLDELNPYARIVADEALRRGIRVQVLDGPGGYLRLEHGGRALVTRESLSELTNAVAMSRCDDKRVTRQVVSSAGIVVPEGRTATFDEADHAFLDAHGAVVVKPVRGEQGAGVSVDVRRHEALDAALARAAGIGGEVLVEQHVEGVDLRIVVIGGAVVAAALRRPPQVVGDGTHTVAELVRACSRRRQAATGGESSIPLDDSTRAVVAEAGHDLDAVLRPGTPLVVRRTANLHTGGTIHDVTSELHPELASVAVRAAEAIGIPVTGIDLLVRDPGAPDYVFVEANERPGLANHEPQPTARAFVDLLFPGTTALEWAWQPDEPGTVHDRPS